MAGYCSMQNRFRLQRAAQICHSGGVIAYPAESVFGLGCDPLNADAVFRILALKKRPVEKGLILLADNLQKLLPFIAVDAQQQKQLLAEPSRPTTWLVPASALTPYWVRGEHANVAIRITQHGKLAAFCSLLPYPIISTSANPAKKSPARTALRVRQYFDDQLDFIVPAQRSLHGDPSVIRDLETGAILRA